MRWVTIGITDITRSRSHYEYKKLRNVIFMMVNKIFHAFVKLFQVLQYIFLLCALIDFFHFNEFIYNSLELKIEIDSFIYLFVNSWQTCCRLYFL